MLLIGKTSDIAQQISFILSQLEQHEDVARVVLSTGDGLGMTADAPDIERVAAVAGLMAAAVQQARIMLKLQECWEIILQLEGGVFLLFHPFLAGDSRLILTVQFKRQVAYKRLLLQTVQAIQQTMEN